MLAYGLCPLTQCQPPLALARQKTRPALPSWVPQACRLKGRLERNHLRYLVCMSDQQCLSAGHRQFSFFQSQPAAVSRIGCNTLAGLAQSVAFRDVCQSARELSSSLMATCPGRCHPPAARALKQCGSFRPPIVLVQHVSSNAAHHLPRPELSCIG